MPILFAVLFVAVDYGLFFNNSLSARSGVREAARQGVVETVATGACAQQSGYLAQLACEARTLTGPVAGTSYVRTFYGSWTTGQTLTVCAMVKSEGLIGLVPFPKGGWTRSRTDMSIEVTDPVPAGATSYSDPLPAGQDWSWCS